eukprot:g966.t1
MHIYRPRTCVSDSARLFNEARAGFAAFQRQARAWFAAQLNKACACFTAVPHDSCACFAVVRQILHRIVRGCSTIARMVRGCSTIARMVRGCSTSVCAHGSRAVQQSLRRMVCSCSTESCPLFTTVELSCRWFAAAGAHLASGGRRLGKSAL